MNDKVQTPPAVEPAKDNVVDAADILGEDVVGPDDAEPSSPTPKEPLAKKLAALVLALIIALAGPGLAATVQVPTTGTISGLANNQQINIVAGNLATMIEGATAPTTTSSGLSSMAGVWWHDTGNKIIFVRDQADTNWLPAFYLDETGHLIGTAAQAGAWVTVGGTGNAITLTYPVAPAAYAQGMKLAFKATAANSGATTVNVNSLGAKNLYKKGASGAVALAGAEINIGDLVEIEYDGTQFQIVSAIPSGTVTSVTDATNGGINVATGTTTPALSLKPSDLLTKATPTTSDSLVIQDAAASNAAKTATIASMAASSSTTFTGTDIAQWLTAGGFAGNISNASPGYINLPGGMIIQWGVVTSVPISGTKNQTFPVAFPTACYGVVASYQSTTPPANSAAGTCNTTIVSAVNQSSGSAFDVAWVAFGH